MATSENTEVVTTRLTPGAKAVLRADAKRLGLTDAAYVRLILLEKTRRVIQERMNNINTEVNTHEG
jgi:hypothetical protein